MRNRLFQAAKPKDLHGSAAGLTKRGGDRTAVRGNERWGKRIPDHESESDLAMFDVELVSFAKTLE